MYELGLTGITAHLTFQPLNQVGGVGGVVERTMDLHDYTFERSCISSAFCVAFA